VTVAAKARKNEADPSREMNSPTCQQQPAELVPDHHPDPDLGIAKVHRAHSWQRWARPAA